MNLSKKVWSWAIYDWANSAFSTTVMAGFFPLFFEKYWSNPDDVIQSTYQLGLANSAASILIAAVSPFLGAIADRGSAKKKFLFFFAFIGIIMTGGLWVVEQGQWQMAIFFYVIASVGFLGGNIFYDSLLPSVASREKLDFVSSFGFALGYIGGGILFLINVLMYLHPDWFGIANSSTAIKLSFLSVAVWWAVFTIPILFFVPEPKNKNSVPLLHALKAGAKQLKETFNHIREMKVIGMFLLAYWFYIDGVDTIIRMSVKMGSSLGFEAGDLIVALLMVQFIAFPAALAYNQFAQKIGTKNAVFVAIGGYAVITFLAYFMNDPLHFFVLAGLIGLFQGGIQALSRSLYARLIPVGKEGEFFGFYNMLGKFAAVIGPILMGWVTVVTGSVRYGILSILILFILGAFFLTKVDFEEGERLAKEFG
ncbi:MAG: MFS transporter [Candidatus Marinimicrobia bacterium]|nr:MFS transporter [Candidatus Neomarinimicrobiota bacterium]MBT4554131.1 MFS transporter [Candidatus Neomarinimicrobiota bacterium]MBT4753618.1 MFS transporter [Candidatus Neomarinimicrobiota bacterium]MBT5114864.1 MFS transporter [Candidatus Neomarinimicrobiota bacterium]MBT5748191.1 MFS transporter [Candidatus Neomarinimicrobiota bacterium]